MCLQLFWCCCLLMAVSQRTAAGKHLKLSWVKWVCEELPFKIYSQGFHESYLQMFLFEFCWYLTLVLEIWLLLLIPSIIIIFTESWVLSFQMQYWLWWWLRRFPSFYLCKALWVPRKALYKCNKLLLLLLLSRCMNNLAVKLYCNATGCEKR